MPDSNFDDQNNLPQDNPNDNPVPTTPSTEGYVDSSQSEPQSEPTNNDSQFQPPQSTVSSQPPTVPAQKKSKKLLLSMVLIVVIVIIAGGAYMLTKNHNKTKTTGGKKDIALIKYGFDNDPLNSFYPADSSNSGPLPVQSQIFEGLVSFQHGTQIKPQIASSWSNPNDTTWIFNIKPHIYYHDGDTATAQDVVYTWQQINQNDPSYAAYLTNTIKDVKAINNSTVEITTTSPDPILLNRLASMFIIDSKAPKGTPAWGLGAGAYTVKPDTTPSENSLDLVAFNKWNGGHIYTKAVDYTFYANPENEIKDLKSGKINLADGLSLDEVNAQLKNNYNVFYTPQTGTNMIGINTTNPAYPTSNIKIREALNLAISGQEVMKNAQQAGLPDDQVIPQAIPGYNPDIKPITQNVTEASALVKAAGYPNGVTVNLAVGEPVLAIAQEVAKEVKPAGININIQEETDEGQYIDDINSGKDQSWVEELPTSVIDGSDILQGGFVNQPFYTNPTVTTEVDNAITANTATEHIKDLQQASLTLLQDYAYVPLYQLTDVNVSDKGMVFSLNDYDSDLNVYFADVYQQ